MKRGRVRALPGNIRTRMGWIRYRVRKFYGWTAVKGQRGNRAL